MKNTSLVVLGWIFASSLFAQSSTELQELNLFRQFMNRLSVSQEYVRTTPWDEEKTAVVSYEVRRLGPDAWRAAPNIQCGRTGDCPGILKGSCDYFIRGHKIVRGLGERPVKMDVAASNANNIVFVEEIETVKIIDTWSLSEPGETLLFTTTHVQMANGQITFSESIQFQN